MICSKCKASYPMGFKECPDCGASSEFAVLESELSNIEDEVLDVPEISEEPTKSVDIPELKITSLTDENMFIEGFIIPESKPPEDPEPQKPSKKRIRRSKKVPTEELIFPAVEEDINNGFDTKEAVTGFATVEEQVTETPLEDAASEVKKREEAEVEKIPEPEPVKRTPKKSSLFEAMAVEAAQSLGPEGLPEFDTTQAGNMTGVFKKGEIKPLEVEEKLPETAAVEVVEAGKENPDTIPADEPNGAEIKPKSTETGTEITSPPVQRKTRAEKSDKEKEISRSLVFASVFGLLSVFIPILFIPSNVYLNRIPKDADTRGKRVLKTILNILFYINLFCIVLGLISLTKAIALNYQALFSGDFSPLAGEFGKIAPLAIVRTFDFWSSMFSPETGVWLSGLVDTYFSDFISDLSQLENGFDIKIIFSLFGKIGVPIIILLLAIGITGKFVLDRKIRNIEKKLEDTYRIGNFRGETVRALKEQKRNLTFKKKSFVKITIVLLVLTFILTEGYPIISKILPLLSFIKEDIQNTK